MVCGELTSRNLGLDPLRYQTTTHVEEQEKDFNTLESLIPDKQRFKDTDPFVMMCKKCEGSFEFAAVGSVEVREIP